MAEPSRDWVALALAVGLVLALNLALAAVLWDAVTGGGGLTGTGAQVLTAALGGIIGILGSYVGMRHSHRHVTRDSHTGTTGDGQGHRPTGE